MNSGFALLVTQQLNSALVEIRTENIVNASARGRHNNRQAHNVRRKNFNPFTAISSRVGSIRRQMAAARAITFTSVVNDSITTSPLYLIARSAAAIGFQSM